MTMLQVKDHRPCCRSKSLATNCIHHPALGLSSLSSSSNSNNRLTGDGDNAARLQPSKLVCVAPHTSQHFSSGLNYAAAMTLSFNWQQLPCRHLLSSSQQIHQHLTSDDTRLHGGGKLQYQQTNSQSYTNKCMRVESRHNERHSRATYLGFCGFGCCRRQ